MDSLLAEAPRRKRWMGWTGTSCSDIPGTSCTGGVEPMLIEFEARYGFLGRDRHRRQQKGRQER